jgi:hypothetical protein
MSNILGVGIRESDFLPNMNASGSSSTFFCGFFDRGEIGSPILINSSSELIEKLGNITLDNYNDWYQCFNYLNYANNLKVSRAIGKDSKNSTAIYPANNYENNFRVDNFDSVEIFYRNADYIRKMTPLFFIAKNPGSWGNKIEISIVSKFDFDQNNVIYNGIKAQSLFNNLNSGDAGVLIFYDNALVEKYIVDYDSSSTKFIENISVVSSLVYVIFDTNVEHIDGQFSTFSGGSESLCKTDEQITMGNTGVIIVNSNGNFSFTPTLGFKGFMPTVSYTVVDNLHIEKQAKSLLNILVTDTLNLNNDFSEFIEVPKNIITTGNVLSNLHDTDITTHSILSFRFSDSPAVFTSGTTVQLPYFGTFSLSASGDFSFAPSTDFVGEIPLITYTLQDNTDLLQSSSNLHITVLQTVHTVIDGNEFYVIAMNSSISGSLFSNLTISDGDTYSIKEYTTMLDGFPRWDGNLKLTDITGDKQTLSFSFYGDNSLVLTGGISTKPTYDELAEAHEMVRNKELDIDYIISNERYQKESLLIGESRADCLVFIGAPNFTNSVSKFQIDSFTVAGNSNIYRAEDTAIIENIGKVKITAEGMLTFDSFADFFGLVPAITYNLSEVFNETNIDSSIMNIKVESKDSAIFDSSETFQMFANTSLTGNILSDAKGKLGVVDILYFSFVGNSTNFLPSTSPITIANVGTIAISQDGTFVFVPLNNFVGKVPKISYMVTDNNSNFDSSELQIVVNENVPGLYDDNEYISIYQDGTLSKNLFDNLVTNKFTTVIEKTVNLRTNIFVESKHSVFIMNYKNVYNDYFKKNFLVNLAGDAAGIRAQTDYKFNKWTVSAGETRGILKGGTLVNSFPKNVIDDMYLKGINSFLRDSQGNIRLYGNRIMTFSFSSLNRITTRNLFNHLSKNLEKFARLFVFDFINSNTTNAIQSILNSFMENVKADRGISEYKVQVSTDQINNIITVDVFVRPVNAIDYIQLRFENAGNNSISNVRSSI